MWNKSPYRENQFSLLVLERKVLISLPMTVTEENTILPQAVQLLISTDFSHDVLVKYAENHVVRIWDKQFLSPTMDSPIIHTLGAEPTLIHLIRMNYEGGTGCPNMEQFFV
jgi:hypothetical protein